MIPHILHSVPIEKREGKMEEIISIAEVVYVCFFFFLIQWPPSLHLYTKPTKLINAPNKANS